jgi:hypothetical protein
VNTLAGGAKPSGNGGATTGSQKAGSLELFIDEALSLNSMEEEDILPSVHTFM